VTYSLALQSRLNACESLLDRLRCANDTERLRILEEHFSNKKRKRSTNPEGPLPDSPQSDESADNEMIELLNETSVDEDGRICFYGTTSLFHLKPDQSTMSRTRTSDTILVLPEETTPSVQWLNTPSPSLSTSAQPDIKSYLNIDISSEICNELLETYWCWPHNIHLVLCRKIFMRAYQFATPL
jgi:hypothetical protein